MFEKLFLLAHEVTLTKVHPRQSFKGLNMKLLKPAFVHNQDRPIFSIDIHPKEAKFATVSNKNNRKDFPGIKIIFVESQLAGRPRK